MIGSGKSFYIWQHIFLGLLALVCIFPFLILAASSFTAESSLVRNGYSLFPEVWSLESYSYLFRGSNSILRAYGITVLVTVFGTALGLIMTTLMAYALSVPDLPLKSFFSFFVFFTMLFNGGLVPSYIMWTTTFNITNTVSALIFPRILVSAFNIIIMRTYFQTNIPQSVLEASRIDGAKEWRIFNRIVLPMSVPIIATIGLMIGITYWNDWLNGLYYVTDSKLFSIQNMLNRMLKDIQFLQNSLTGMDNLDTSKLPSSGVKMAVAMMGAVPLMVVFPFFQKYYVKGLTIGALKG